MTSSLIHIGGDRKECLFGRIYCVKDFLFQDQFLNDDSK